MTQGNNDLVRLAADSWLLLRQCPQTFPCRVCGDGFGKQGAGTLTLALGSLRLLQTLE